MKEIIFKSQLGNYYGNINIERVNRKVYLTLENWQGVSGIEIDEEFIEIFISQLRNKKIKYLYNINEFGKFNLLSYDYDPYIVDDIEDEL